MKIYDSLNKQTLPLSVALGYFDGVHKGHKAVIKEAVSFESFGLVPAVFTFKRSPRSILYDINEYQITDNETKEKIFEDLGVKILYLINFEEIKDLTPKQFVRNILKEKLNAKCVICGFNYHFGKGGTGDANQLKNLCLDFGIKTKIIKPVLYKAGPISSSRIRKALEENDTISAQNMLSK